MIDSGYAYARLEELRIGLYVDLELGWMSHPFPKGNFKITSTRQIDTLRALGVERVRYVPARSDPAPLPVSESPPAPAASLSDERPGPSGPSAPDDMPDSLRMLRQQQAVQIAAQRASLDSCDQQFDAAIRQYRRVLEQIPDEPDAAAGQCRELVSTLVGDLLGQSESSIRLLSESTGDRAWMHPVNVTVLSLLLGKALGMQAEPLRELGLAALLHDVGKTQLPDRVRLSDASFAPAQYRQYQSHVALGVAMAQQLGFSADVQATIAQHHEMLDGSGFPHQLRGSAISQAGKVLALVNRYENMCNPARVSAAATPHEALSLIFSQMKDRHDVAVLGKFIRMMGIYPPGSVVQLSDSRYALVVSVNSARPHKPRVMVHDRGIDKEQALILDLEHAPEAGIRRSLRPDLLPREAMDYLAPRLRICYFFERTVDPVRAEIVP